MDELRGYEQKCADLRAENRRLRWEVELAKSPVVIRFCFHCGAPQPPENEVERPEAFLLGLALVIAIAVAGMEGIALWFLTH